MFFVHHRRATGRNFKLNGRTDMANEIQPTSVEFPWKFHGNLVEFVLFPPYSWGAAVTLPASAIGHGRTLNKCICPREAQETRNNAYSGRKPNLQFLHGGVKWPGLGENFPTAVLGQNRYIQPLARSHAGPVHQYSCYYLRD